MDSRVRIPSPALFPKLFKISGVLSIMDKTWELIVEPERPIAVADLETEVREGSGLHFPISRSYLFNLVNTNWNRFIVDMASRKREDIKRGLDMGDDPLFYGSIKHIAGISSMYRLSDAHLEGGVLRVTAGMTDFKQYIGTTQYALEDEDFRQLLIDAGVEDHDDLNHYFANPIACCTNIVTSDGKVPLGMRSQKVAIYPGVPHVIGGYVKVNGDNNPDFSVRDVDFSQNLLKEVSQELGIDREQIAHIDFLGIVRNCVTRGPEFMYNIQLTIDAKELHERWHTQSRDKFEHRNIDFHDRGKVPDLLDQHRGKMVPSGEANLELFVRHYN